MNRDQKAAAVAEIAQSIQESEAVFAVDYRGISVPQAAQLRTRLREADASFRVVKNTLTLRAADQAGAEALKALLEGPTAMTFVRGDAAAAAKALRDFNRATTLLQFKGGWMNGAPLTGEEIQAIAQLPSRDVLYGRLVSMVASPLTGLASALNGLIGGLARQLSQIAEQGLVGGDASAPQAVAVAEPPAADTPADEPAESPAPAGESPAQDTPSTDNTEE
jgi:large subunit ribosomal protein L10